MYVSPKTHKLIAVESHYKGMLDNPSSTKKKKKLRHLVYCLHPTPPAWGIPDYLLPG